MIVLVVFMFLILWISIYLGVCLVLNELSQFGNVELFVGDSGTSYSEFVEKNICLNEFASIACKLLEENGCDIHFIISEHNNSKYV